MEWQPQGPGPDAEPHPDPAPESPEAEPVRRPGGWGYADVALFLVFAVVSLLFSSLIGYAMLEGWKAVSGAQVDFDDPQGQTVFLVSTQIFWFLLLAGFIYLLIRGKYGLAFADAIGWRAPERPPWMYLGGGVVLAFSVLLAASIIPLPEEDLPIEALFRDRWSVVVLTIYGVFIAPPCEELIFRGYLFSPIERIHGAVAAVLATSLFFSIVHAPQYGGHWQNLALLFYVSLVLGIVRVRTQSMLTTTIVHAAYNLTLFSGVLLARDQIENL